MAADHIVFQDENPVVAEKLENRFGYGTLALRLGGVDAPRSTAVDSALDLESIFAALDRVEGAGRPVETSFDTRPVGALGGRVALRPGEERTVVFVLAWHFPRYPRPSGEMGVVQDLARLQRHYAARLRQHLR